MKFWFFFLEFNFKLTQYCMVSWYYLVSWYFSWYSIVRHFYGIVTTLVGGVLNKPDSIYCFAKCNIIKVTWHLKSKLFNTGCFLQLARPVKVISKRRWCYLKVGSECSHVLPHLPELFSHRIVFLLLEEWKKTSSIHSTGPIFIGMNGWKQPKKTNNTSLGV